MAAESPGLISFETSGELLSNTQQAL